MSTSESLTARRQQILSIFGMAMVWPSIHNQVLYPLTFSFHKEGADSPFLYYILYSLVMLVAVIGLLLMNRKGLARRLFNSTPLIAAIGLMGSVGISLLVVCDFGNELARWFMGIGVAFSAVFVPVYFIFWSTRLLYASQKRVAFDLVLSYLVFSLITLVRLTFEMHAWAFSIAYPLISMVLAVAVMRGHPAGKYALGNTPLKGLPLFMIVPTAVFVYLASGTRLLLNPASAAFDYPPYHRLIIYLVLAVLCVVLCVLYRPRGKMRRNADLLGFSIVAVFLVGAILLTGVGLVGEIRMGNLPSVTGINAAELFIWLVVLVNAQAKHAGIVRPAAVFLVFVVGATHLASALFLGGVEMFNFDTAQLPLISITIGLAFLVVIVVMSVMAIMLYNARLQPASPFAAPIANAAASPLVGNAAASPAAPATSTPTAGGAGLSEATSAPAAPMATPAAAAMPPCVTMAADEAAIERIQESFGLSRRETDTLRLAARNKSAKEIAESLFVAESTVNSHIKGIYRKCDVHSRQELIALVNRFKREQK